MAWTYGGDPAANARDAIRFLVGDTDTTDQLLTDEEIAWVNTEASGSATGLTALYDAASRCCITIAAKMAREADKQVGDLSVSMSQRAKAYREQAQSLKALSAREGGVPVPYAGGITISDKEIDLENSDLVRGSFRTGQFENVRDGGSTELDNGISYFGPGADL
jgi:hypothetical protein